MLDLSESGSSKLLVKRQSNNDAHGYVVFMPLVVCKPLLAAYDCGIYIHTGVGFGVARSYK